MTHADRDDGDDGDDLLERLGAIEREYDDRFPHEWEDAVRGQRSVEEVAAARREAGDDPEEVRALAAVLGPIDEAERAQWVDRLAGLAAARGDDPASSATGSEPAGEAAAAVISLTERRRGRATWATAGLGVLVAAALALWVMPRGPGSTSIDGAGSLPGFGLVVRNETVRDVRSTDVDPTQVPRYRADTQVHWIVRPERSVAGSLGLRVLAEAVGPGLEPARRLIDPGPVTVSDRGVIELRGTFGSTLALPPGRWSLRLVVGDPPPSDLAAFDAGGPWATVEPAHVIDVIP